MRNAWLIKSEPSVYSFSTLVLEGQTRWDGIRNFEARNNLRAMKLDDLCLFYHSGTGKEIVGIARVAKEAYPDPADGEWSCVDIAPITQLKQPVGLDVIKKNPKLKGMAIVKKSRLSVSPVTVKEFDAVLALGKTKVRA
jgi:predicted RNA-binding protein with PUA-like domain